jgi:hypothetical protein
VNVNLLLMRLPHYRLVTRVSCVPARTCVCASTCVHKHLHVCMCTFVFVCVRVWKERTKTKFITVVYGKYGFMSILTSSVLAR